LISSRYIYRILAFTAFLVLASCSVEKNTGLSRFYNSLTARFNIYFNGHESFKSGLQKIYSGYTDDYGELLRVFEFSDPSTAQLASGDMDRAISKASKLITLKSITAKPGKNDKVNPDQKEFNSWVDDSYLLIAKARFYKHEFQEAARVFTYNITEANDPLIRTESLLWLARIENEEGDYSEARRVLNEIDQAEMSTSLKAMYYTTLADLSIREKDYPAASESLKNSLEYITGKRNKYRLTFLLAQLYELSGQPAAATDYYRQVIRMNPPYNVEFMARINIAGGFDIKTGNPEQMKLELEKMLKDSKNRDFHDQIYYALGEMAMKEGKADEALDYYRKSVASGQSNQNQKGRSYMAMADYYYNKGDFIPAGTYYDSAVFFIDPQHPQFKLMKAKAENLNSLVTELNTIQLEDSLQRVALMPENERTNLIASLISNAAKMGTEGRTADNQRYNLGQYYENERRFQGNIEQEGKWYFYNQAALTFGRTEFRKRWGDRKLEDNWRRSNRARSAAQLTAGNEDNAGKKGDTVSVVMDQSKPEFYLKNLPLTPGLLDESNERLAKAYINAAKAYAEKIGDKEKATEMLELLLKRFPENELAPEALYNLYNINREISSSKAETYRQRLLEKYPGSEYAHMLSDPDYYKKKQAGLKMAEDLYEHAYDAYRKGDYNEAETIALQGIERYSEDVLAPKFQFLKAIITGKTRSEKEFRDELNNVVKKWPATEESMRAGEMITWLDQKTPELRQEEDKQIAREIYVADTTSRHSFALVITDPKFNINQATFDVINYNIDNHTNRNYKAEGTLVDNKYILITVSGFSSFRQAMDYYNNFRIEKIVRNPTNSGIMKFLISGGNLQALNDDKDPQRYLLFFNEKYLSQPGKN
jgi:tetratricopeptide (TPR) repeat protein